MKRQKRNKTERAYHKGYQSGVSGRSQDICPHTEATLRQFWMSGWRTGRVDHWEGYTGISGLQPHQSPIMHISA